MHPVNETETQNILKENERKYFVISDVKTDMPAESKISKEREAREHTGVPQRGYSSQANGRETE